MASSSVVYRNASVVTARPIVPGPIAEPAPPDALAAGSQINKAAIGGPYKATELGSGSSLNESQIGSPWPNIINGAIKFFNSWRPNGLREIANHNVSGNYGEVTSKANFGFRSFEFGVDSIGGMPDSDLKGGGHRPEWNNLIPIIWGLRVINPVAAGSANYTVQPQSTVSQMTRSTEFSPTGTASLSMKGEVLQ